MAAGGLVLASVLILDPRMCCCLHCFLSQGHNSCLALRFSPPKTKQNTIDYLQDHHIFFFIELLVWFLTLRVNAPKNKAFFFLFFFFLALKRCMRLLIFFYVLTKINSELYMVINNNKFVYFNSKLSWEVKINILFFRRKIKTEYLFRLEI